MSTNRISTHTSMSRLITENMRLQSAMAETQMQLSSGLKSMNYKGISDVTQKLLNVESNYTALETYDLNSKAVNSSISIMYSSVGSMVELANNFKTTLTQALGGSMLNPQVTHDQAKLLMEETVGLLNVQSAGNYLFSGTTIDVVPVNINDPAWTAPTIPSVANDSYYKGNNQIQSLQVSESLTIHYGVTANNPAFEKILRAYNMVVAHPADTNAIKEASDLISEGIKEMANVQAQISTAAKTIENQQSRNAEDKLVMKNIIADFKAADLAETTLRQAEIKTQIEAAYASSVKLINLKLTDYI